MNKQVDREKIAKWLGLSSVHINDEDVLIYRAYPRYKPDPYNWKWKKVPDFADPKQGIGYLFNIIVIPRLWYCKMDLLEGLFFVWEVEADGYLITKGPTDENPALALALAIENMIDRRMTD